MHYVSRGYSYFCMVELPKRKQSKWEAIDQKLIEKYGINIAKWNRRYRKKQGRMNFAYVRWEDQAVLLHTKGKIDDEITMDDTFLDSHKDALTIRVGDQMVLELAYIDDHATYKIHPTIYRDLKAEIADAAERRDVKHVVETIEHLNGLPAWKGIFEQKLALYRFAKTSLAKHQQKLPAVFIRRKRTPIKVWQH